MNLEELLRKTNNGALEHGWNKKNIFTIFNILMFITDSVFVVLYLLDPLDLLYLFTIFSTSGWSSLVRVGPESSVFLFKASQAEPGVDSTCSNTRTGSEERCRRIKRVMRWSNKCQFPKQNSRSKKSSSDKGACRYVIRRPERVPSYFISVLSLKSKK